jgi:hypothetical protein
VFVSTLACLPQRRRHTPWTQYSVPQPCRPMSSKWCRSVPSSCASWPLGCCTRNLSRIGCCQGCASHEASGVNSLRCLCAPKLCRASSVGRHLSHPCGQPMVSSVLIAGGHASVIACGPAGGGKTYTMMGDPTQAGRDLHHEGRPYSSR